MENTKAARLYLRVSTEAQDLERQRALVDSVKAQGYYLAGVYEDKASGATANRPGLRRMIDDLQPGDVVIAERMDRLTRGPLAEAEALVDAIKAKGATLSVPGLLDLDEVPADPDSTAGIVLQGMQRIILRLVLKQAREDYELRRERQAQGIELAKAQGKYRGRPRDERKRERILACLRKGMGVRETARVTQSSPSTVSKLKKELSK